MDFLKIRRKAKERVARASPPARPAPPAGARPAPPAEARPAARPKRRSAAERPPATDAAPAKEAPQAKEAPPAPPAEAAAGAERPQRPARSLPGSPEALRLDAEMGSRVAALPFAPDARFVTWRPDGGEPPELAAVAPVEVERAPAPAWPPVPLAPLDEFFYSGDEVAPGLVAAAPTGIDLVEPVVLEEYLVFLVAGEAYAVPIGSVLEVLRTPAITEVPRAPADVPGVITVRGDVITVVDPRSRLGMAGSTAPLAGRVVVVDDGEGACGLLVERVAGVVRLPGGALEPCPQSLGIAGRELFLGIGREQ